MTPDDQQSQLLAQWLAMPPGADPPVGLSEQVVAAVYSIRPDRSPTPHTRLEDILAAVRTGPYAQHAKFAVVSTDSVASTSPPTSPGEESSDDEGAPSGEIVPLYMGRDEIPQDVAPVATPEGEVVSLNAARERVQADAAARDVQKDAARADRMRKARRWWLGPMFGAGVAAAAVLLVVGPIAGTYLSPTASRLADEMVASESEAAAPQGAAAPADAPGLPATAVTAPLPEMAASEAARQQDALGDMAVSGGVAGEGAQALGYSADQKAGARGDKDSELRREDAAMMPPVEPTPAAPPYGPSGSAGYSPTVPPAEERLRKAGDAGGAEGIAELEESPAQVESKDNSWGWSWGKKEKASSADETDADDEQRGAQVVTKPAPAKSAGRAQPLAQEPEPTVASESAPAPAPVARSIPEVAPTDRSSGAAAPAPDGAAESGAVRAPSSRSTTTSKSPAAPATTAAASPPPVSAPVSKSTLSAAATDLRTAAVPRDYASNWYTARSDVAATYATAESARAAGNVDGAVLAYSALLANPDPRVVQDAAWRAAGALRGSGRISEALTMIERGLAKSSANISQRSQLLVLKGDLLAAQGNSAGAQAAWGEASRLNAARIAPQAAPVP